MMQFLKRLWNLRRRKITVLLLEDDKPDLPQAFKVNPYSLVYLVSGSVVCLIIIFGFLYAFTPVGNIFYSRHDRQLRQQVIILTQKMVSLTDSMNVRDRQLNDIKKVLTGDVDTTFNVPKIPDIMTDQSVKQPVTAVTVSTSEKMIDNQDIVNSDVLNKNPIFPAPLPVEGTLTRGFKPTENHYGIDIAAQSGSYVRAVADGTVINTEWTLNYGYIIYIQHQDGYVTIYKHCTNIVKHVGDVVVKGDILGTIGQSGIISSGPHVHMELWHNGVALDPIQYLTTNQ